MIHADVSRQLVADIRCSYFLEPVSLKRDNFPRVECGYYFDRRFVDLGFIRYGCFQCNLFETITPIARVATVRVKRS